MVKIKVRLFATLREGRGKELMLEVDENSTVLTVMEKLTIPRKDVALLLINGRDGLFDRPLSPDDTVSLFPPVGGG